MDRQDVNNIAILASIGVASGTAVGLLDPLSAIVYVLVGLVVVTVGGGAR